MHEIPITRLGSDGVGGEESHSVDLGLGIVLSGESATDDVVVVNLQNERLQPHFNSFFFHFKFIKFSNKERVLLMDSSRCVFDVGKLQACKVRYLLCLMTRKSVSLIYQLKFSYLVLPLGYHLGNEWCNYGHVDADDREMPCL